MRGVKGLIILAATVYVGTGLRCGLCLYSTSHSECKTRDHACESDQNHCFMQKMEDEHGNTHYKGGCATSAMCKFMKFKPSLSLGKRDPLPKHTCEECCTGKDTCNVDLCYTPSVANIFHSVQTTESTTTTTKPTAPAVPAVPAQCEVCSGPLCGLHTMKYSFLCPHDKPYCMNTVVNSANGTKHITKSCAAISDCRQKWWLDSSSRSECQHFAVNEVFPFEFTCNYCCTSDDCNRDLIPKQQTVYEGSH